MRPPPDFELRLRLILLILIITITVSVPYFFLQRASDNAVRASQWVEESSEAKQALLELMYSVRAMDALALNAYARQDVKNGPATYVERRARTEVLLQELRNRTLDNAEQQNHIGRLQAMVEGRIGQMDEVLLAVAENRFSDAAEALRKTRELFPILEAANDVRATEETVFAERKLQADERRRYSRWLGAFALLVQLALLLGASVIYDRAAVRRDSAETEASRAVARADAVLQSVREPIALVDQQLRLLMSNAAFDEVYGGKPAEGQLLREIGGNSWSNPELLQRLGDVLARDRELWDFDVVQNAEGMQRRVFVNARRISLPERLEPAVLVTVNDVTAVKHAEEQIRDLNRELQSRMAQVSEVNSELESFSYSVSHDLRAPLRHISGFSDKLERHLEDRNDDTSRHYLDVIRTSARRMSNLIEDLLQYSRLGRNALRPQPVDMQQLAEEAQSLLAEEVGDRDVQWHISGLPTVMADASMMRQVWQNLLGNAVKYTSPREQARIKVSAEHADNGDAVFHVADNGTGFDMAYSDKVFGVFQRLHKTSEFPGTGIGLANVQRIVLRHGGRIWFDAEPDKGATFHFSLPAIAAATEHLSAS